MFGLWVTKGVGARRGSVRSIARNASMLAVVISATRLGAAPLRRDIGPRGGTRAREGLLESDGNRSDLFQSPSCERAFGPVTKEIQRMRTANLQDQNELIRASNRPRGRFHIFSGQTGESGGGMGGGEDNHQRFARLVLLASG